MINTHSAAITFESSSAPAGSPSIQVVKGTKNHIKTKEAQISKAKPTAVFVDAVYKRDFSTASCERVNYARCSSRHDGLESQVLLSSLTAPEHLNAHQLCFTISRQDNPPQN